MFFFIYERHQKKKISPPRTFFLRQCARDWNAANLLAPFVNQTDVVVNDHRKIEYNKRAEFTTFCVLSYLALE